MKTLFLILLPLCLCQVPSTLTNTPPMGWMSWEIFRCEVDCDSNPDACIDENLYKAQTDALVAGGYLAAGYDTISIDDCWEQLSPSRVDGKLAPNATRFPAGMKALGDYMHSKGVNFGIYTDEGTKTCGGYPGSKGYETVDAQTFASWGVDYLKVDGCYNDAAGYIEGYPAFGKALQASGRGIVYSCSWPAYQGNDETTKSYPAMIAAGCDTWRNWGDIQDSWGSLSSIIEHWGEYDVTLQKYGSKHHWNDMDMLLIGNGGLNLDESKTQMAIWSIMASPLIMGNDLRKVTDEYKAILLNKEVIAVSQDELGIPGLRIVDGDQQVWARNLSDGSYAVALYGKASNVHAECTWSVTNGSYAESSGGGAGNIICSTDYLSTVKSNCCDDSHCTSFSFQNGLGENKAFYCEKNNKDGGVVTNSAYDGYVVESRTGGDAQVDVSIDFTSLGFGECDYVQVRDLFEGKDLGAFEGRFSAKVNKHGTMMLKISKGYEKACLK